MEIHKFCNCCNHDKPGKNLVLRVEWLYQISSFFNPVEFDIEDERLISLGNKEVVISGLTLIELMEEYRFSFIGERPSCGRTFEEAIIFLNSFIEAQKYWGIQSPKMDYEESLKRIKKEQQRVKQCKMGGF